jgi:hypothetical protein
MKIKIKQSHTQIKLVRSAMFCSVIVFAVYVSMYVSIVSTGIQLNKEMATVKQKNQELANIERDFASKDDTFSMQSAEALGLYKISDSHFAVRKTEIGSLSFIYEAQ